MLTPIQAPRPYVSADCSPIKEPPPSRLIKVKSIKHDVFNVFYHFEDIEKPNESLVGKDSPVMATYPTNLSGLTKDQAFKLCTDIIINSSVAAECGPYFDSNIMIALNICMQGTPLLFPTLSLVFCKPF